MNPDVSSTPYLPIPYGCPFGQGPERLNKAPGRIFLPLEQSLNLRLDAQTTRHQRDPTAPMVAGEHPLLSIPFEGKGPEKDIPMTTRVITTADDSVDPEVERLRQETASRKEAERNTVTIHLPKQFRNVQPFNGTDGSTTYADKRSEGMAVNVDPRAEVIVNGIPMSRQQYLRLVQQGAIPPKSKIVDRGPLVSRELPTETKLPFDEGEAEAPEQTRQETEGNSTADPEVEKVFEEGQKALDGARATLGSDAVEQAIQSVVVSGDPAALPQGVTSTEAGKVISAYVQSATEMIADAGITLEDMVAVLDDKSLQDARLATVKGDVSRMRSLAASTVDQLASLPSRDPAAFAEYVEARWPGLDWKVEKGQTLVHVEGGGYMPFASLVRGGFLKNARAVPFKDED